MQKLASMKRFSAEPLNVHLHVLTNSIRRSRACAGGLLSYDLRAAASLQGTATTSGDVAHDLSKAKALSNALVVMCGELPACAEILLSSTVTDESKVLCKWRDPGNLCNLSGISAPGCSGMLQTRRASQLS